jgi:hypothetical protein
MARKVYTAKDWKNAGIVGLITVPFIIWFLNSTPSLPSDLQASSASSILPTRSVPATAKSEVVATTDVTDAVDAPAWQFHEATDSFSNQKFQYATVKSLNIFNFEFPYQGEQHATLLYEPQLHGSFFEAFIRLDVERGQFICTGEYCHVLVKFDDGTLLTWSGNLPSDGSTNELRMQVYDDGAGGNAECFALKMARTKLITIRAEFYQEGTRDMEFNVAGLSDLSLPKPSQTQLRKCRAPKAIARSAQR